jgi:hypothetical protein
MGVATLRLMLESIAAKQFRAAGCQLSIERLRAGRLLIVLEGTDVGQLGREPFRELEKRLATDGPLELFFDLRRADGATLEASGSWAIWLRANQQRIDRVGMLTARPVIGLSAKTVARFSQLGSKARLYSNARDFEHALSATT